MRSDKRRDSRVRWQLVWNNRIHHLQNLARRRLERPVHTGYGRPASAERDGPSEGWKLLRHIIRGWYQRARHNFQDDALRRPDRPTEFSESSARHRPKGPTDPSVGWQSIQHNVLWRRGQCWNGFQDDARWNRQRTPHVLHRHEKRNLS